MLDAALCYAEALICRFDPQRAAGGTERTRRDGGDFAPGAEEPGSKFVIAFDLEGLKAAIALAKGEKPAAPKKK